MKINAAVEKYEVHDRTPNLTRVAVTVHNVGHHMRTLAESTYSKPIEAAVRETIANAIDGSKGKRFSVTPPSLLDPNFRVRDYGVGMDEAFFTTGYAAMGFSTKRDSNDEIGGFGGGRFAVFSYKGCDQFYVRGFKNGRFFLGSVSRNAEFEVFVQVEQRGHTMEPDGVEVVIPVLTADHSKFIEAIKLYTEFVDTADTPVERISRPVVMEGPGWKLNSLQYFTDFAGPQRRAIMGGIPYELVISNLPDYKLQTLANKFAWGDFFFDIGELSVSFSRESLRYDDVTIAALTKKFKQIDDDLVEREKLLTADCKTDWERKSNKDVIALRQMFNKDLEEVVVSNTPIFFQDFRRMSEFELRSRKNRQRIRFEPKHTFHIYLADCDDWRRRLAQDIMPRVTDASSREEFCVVFKHEDEMNKLLGNPPFKRLSQIAKPPVIKGTRAPSVKNPNRYMYEHRGEDSWNQRPLDLSTPGVYVPFSISRPQETWLKLLLKWPSGEKLIGIPAADIAAAEAAGWVRFDNHLKDVIRPQIKVRSEDMSPSFLWSNVAVLDQHGFQPPTAALKKLWHAWQAYEQASKWATPLRYLDITPTRTLNMLALYAEVEARHPALYVAMTTDIFDTWQIKGDKERILVLARKLV